jgi:uncharacterized protein YdcH (DUF465 family)
MDALSSLKRPADETDFDKCLICQAEKIDKMIDGSAKGMGTLKQSAQERLKKKDISCRDAIDRILSYMSDAAVWHKSCYSTFTSKKMISRLNVDRSGLTCKGKHQSRDRQLRVKSCPIEWEKCLFCQEVKNEQLHSIQSFNTSNKILEAAHYDQKLSIALAGVNDLMAAEGSYHLKCYSKFQRDTKDIKDATAKGNLAMAWLITQLKTSSSKGHILALEEVWQYYTNLCQDTNEEVPRYFISRRTSFKEKVESLCRDIYEFHVLEKADDHEKGTVLVPREFCHIPIAKMLSTDEEEEDNIFIPMYKPQDDIFLSLVHTALKLRSDILAHPPYKGVKVSKEAALSCVPDSVYMFLKVLYGGPEVLEDSQDKDDNSDDKNADIYEDRLLSVAQDLIYGVSHGKMFTPKHVGLGSTLHQATRSRELVDLFHKAGHIVGYRNILQIDTALAEATLKSLNPHNGAIVPENLQPNIFVHFSTDNTDIMDASLDGKNTFHATQVTAWQRGPPSETDTLESIQLSQKKLVVPEVMINNIPPERVINHPTPVFHNNIKMEWYTKDKDSTDPHIRSAQAKDTVFLMRRCAEDPRAGWSQFNQDASSSESPQTTIGFLPIILSPAHEYDTLNTVVIRCKHIAESLGQKYVVITVDEALYCKLMELKWSQEGYSFLIPRLGGLHTAMNFMKVIGQHFEGSGLLELWVESDLLGSKTAERVLAGKDYEKGMRAHKITFQALWELLMPQLMQYLEQNKPQLKQKIEEADSADDNIPLLSVFDTQDFHDAVQGFCTAHASNANFKMWFSYLEMISILLLFTRADRDGLWDLHMSSFRMLLPYFQRYGHINYLKWGSVYYAEMQMLPPEVKHELQKGNFPVKIGSGRFNQVSPDQSQEWLNGTGKKGGGIIGITKNITALSRWALSFNLRSQISKDTKEMYGVGLDHSTLHKETSKSRRRQDTDAEKRVVQKLVSFGVFSDETGAKLRNIVTKDQATDEISESLTKASQFGQEQLELFVQERLLIRDDGDTAKKFYDPMKRNHPPTFAKLYEIKRTDMKTDVVKADRSVLQRLVISYAAGREVDLNNVLKHELLPVPLSLAEMNGSLRSGPKHFLMDALLARPGVNHSDNLNVPAHSTLIIDGQALVVAQGNIERKTCKTFGDFSTVFMNAVFRYGSPFERIDLVFDRYDQQSIKAGTRTKRKRSMPIRRVIEHRDVPLPHDWGSFLSDPENKADLANFLSQEVIISAPEDKIVITGGGLTEADAVLCNNQMIDLEQIKSTQEEADTRMVLHCGHTDSQSVVVWSRDTDVLLLLVAHSPVLNKVIYMKAGTGQVPKYICINDIYTAWNFQPNDVLSLLSFHAITGTDTTSFLAGHTKKTALPVFMDNKQLLSGLGKDPLTAETLQKSELFLCKVYNVNDTHTTDEARVSLFNKGMKQDLLPPTSDATKYHIMRSHYQSLVWHKTMEPKPDIPSAKDYGWKVVNDVLVPVLVTLPPVPESCINLVRCSCSGTCITKRCGCRKSKMVCTGMCKCTGHCLHVAN